MCACGAGREVYKHLWWGLPFLPCTLLVSTSLQPQVGARQRLPKAHLGDGPCQAQSQARTCCLGSLPRVPTLREDLKSRPGRAGHSGCHQQQGTQVILPLPWRHAVGEGKGPWAKLGMRLVTTSSCLANGAQFSPAPGDAKAGLRAEMADQRREAQPAGQGQAPSQMSCLGFPSNSGTCRSPCSSPCHMAALWHLGHGLITADRYTCSREASVSWGQGAGGGAAVAKLLRGPSPSQRPHSDFCSCLWASPETH